MNADPFDGYFAERLHYQEALRRVPEPFRDYTLTRRQLDVLRCSAAGMSRRQTADIMGIAPATVAHHWKQITNKLACRNQAHAVALAIRAGLIA